MQVELTLRDAMILRQLLETHIETIQETNDANYPNRDQDAQLRARLKHASDPHWNR